MAIQEGLFVYENLRVVWWLMLVLMLSGFLITEGRALGIAAVLHLISRSELERRTVIGAVEASWGRRQVWFVLGMGTLIAAWPLLYAAAISAFSIIVMLVPLALLLPVGFAYRNKGATMRSRKAWDWALTVFGLLQALMLGVAVGNLFLGVPFHFTEALQPIHDGAFVDLFHPYALATGVLSLAMLVMHGATFAAAKGEAPVGLRARRVARLAALLALLTFSICGIWLLWIPGHVIQSAIDPSAPSNPMGKEVWAVSGAWLRHHGRHEWTLLLPASAVAALLAVMTLRRSAAGLVASGIALVAMALTAGIALFPFLLPSSVDPAHGLTVWDASSTSTLLGVLLIAIVVLPSIIFACRTRVVFYRRQEPGARSQDATSAEAH